MTVTIVNLACCVIGLMIGLYTLFRHLNALNSKGTRFADAWLVCVGSLAWSVAAYAMIDVWLDQRTLDHYELGITRIETFSKVLFLIYWIGALLQVQKHCLRLRLKRRALERKNAN